MSRFMIAAITVGTAVVAYASHSHNGSVQLHISTMHDNNGTATGPGSLDEE